METQQIDCERFVRGSQEIDRKRKVITLILSTVDQMVWKIKRKDYGWECNQRI